VVVIVKFAIFSIIYKDYLMHYVPIKFYIVVEWIGFEIRPINNSDDVFIINVNFDCLEIIMQLLNPKYVWADLKIIFS
jgi:hypothetical protein